MWDISGHGEQRGAIRAWRAGLGGQLSVDHKMPLEQIGCLFGDLYGYELISETVESRGAAPLCPYEEGYELAAPGNRDEGAVAASRGGPFRRDRCAGWGETAVAAYGEQRPVDVSVGA